ncbi:hypothetical protein TNCV_3439811 [Trichonephila clavipes]|nr:hypothetical protein TNCV_3439811 [Trichonephila clavipes]
MRTCQSKYYDEESVKCLLEGILEEKREEREKREIKKFEERRLAREFELERLRAQLNNKLNVNELKAWNRINNFANVCILSENRTAEREEREEPGLRWRKGKSPALDGEGMRGEPWLERTGRERERKGLSLRLEWKDEGTPVALRIEYRLTASAWHMD